jgi:hypothetical protein
MEPTILGEKATLAALIGIFGKDTVSLEQKNHWGDRGKYSFHFWIDPLAKRFGLIDHAPPGYSHQFDIDLGGLLEKELVEKGFTCTNIWVGSWVHGWIHRVVTFKT